MCEQYNDYPHIFINNALITQYSKVILVKVDYSSAINCGLNTMDYYLFLLLELPLLRLDELLGLDTLRVLVRLLGRE